MLVVAMLWAPGPASGAFAGPVTPDPDPSGVARILRAGGFDEPLVALSAPTPDETGALQAALDQYSVAARHGSSREAVLPVEEFLRRHPGSPWRASILLNLATVYRQMGRLSRALDTLQQAWAETKGIDSPPGRALGDSAVAHLSQFEAYLGRKELLAPLLDEIRGRDLHGSAAELVSESSRGLAEMRERPGMSFKCGPYALYRIERHEHPGAHLDPRVSRLIIDAQSTPNGLPLPAVRDLSRKIGMNLQMAFREQGAEVILPAVVHWKVGHYAALVERTGEDYVVEDSTFGENIRVEPSTLDEEASGYFLVRAGALPGGWRPVAEEKGNQVWGRGDTGDNKDNGDTGPCSGGPGGGCTSPNVQAMVVGLTLQDTPLGYAPPVGPPVKFGMVYAHRDALQPAVFGYTNFGNKWTTTWLSYVTDTYAANGTAMLYGRGGGSETFAFSAPSNLSAPGPFTQAILARQTDANGDTTGFTRQLRDGSIEQYEQAAGTQYFLTSVADPRGQQVTLSYDAQLRITSITDAIGQMTTLSYGLASDPLKVTSVTDPFGRTATFSYTADGHLASITDVLGITSQYTWGASDFITSLTTPYGTSQFTYGDSTTDPTLGTSRFVTVTDALGRTSRVEFVQGAPGINNEDPASSVPANMGLDNTNLEWRNSFIWSPTQLAAATGPSGIDYTKARLIHWLHTPDYSSTSRVIESTKDPLENRVWYTYANQSDSIAMGTSNQPTAIGRVLDDGTTQVTRIQYDALGNVTQTTDPAGRTYSYTYDPEGIDLLTIANTTAAVPDPVLTLAYNSQHEPVSITDASGQTSTFAYDARGQPTSFTDALGQTTTYSYDASEYLTGVQRPGAGATYAFTYDTAGRIAAAKAPSQMTVQFTYDAADRPLTASFPDGTSAAFSYHLLELASSTDRLGHATHFGYDADRELTRITDAAGDQTTLAYCACGRLASITDPDGHATVFSRDLQDRLISRQYADGTQQAVIYEVSTSRVHAVTDALQQTTVYSYNADDTLAGISYLSPLRPTFPVSLAYDSAYRRVVSMTDGTGLTSFSYNPAASPPAFGATQLAQVTSPIAGGSGFDTVALTYDALGRVVGRDVDGATATTAFDALGRVTSNVNALDTFTYGYADGTSRVASLASSHGPHATFSYFDPKGDGLLASISYQGPSGTALADFAYSYDADDLVTSFAASYLDNQVGGHLGSGIDGATGGLIPGLLGGARARSGVSAAQSRPSATVRSARAAESKVLFERAVFVSLVVLMMGLPMVARARRWTWRRGWLCPVLAAQLVLLGCGGMPPPGATDDHDAADEAGAVAPAVTRYAYDAANRLVSAVTTDGPADAGAAPTKQYGYSYDGNSNITSTAANGSTTSLAYGTVDTISGPVPASYDANGNPTRLGDSEYQWDAANRLVAVTRGPSESDFSYDGMSRLVRIVDKQNGLVLADHAYAWCGTERCVERDNTQSGSPITKRYFAEGVQMAGAAYYYVTDRLGSVRELVDASGTLRAQYDYDPYGNPTKTAGDMDSDVTFAGLFHHAPSGLELGTFRAYRSDLGRWLNRDPSGPRDGMNLFGYARGNPANFIDPLGLASCALSLGALAGISIAVVLGLALAVGLALGAGWAVGLVLTALASGGLNYASTPNGTAANAWAGALGGAVGFAVGLVGVEVGLGALLGAASGAAGQATTQVATNAGTGASLSNGLGAALEAGAVVGAVFGVIGTGVASSIGGNVNNEELGQFLSNFLSTAGGVGSTNAAQSLWGLQ